MVTCSSKCDGLIVPRLIVTDGFPRIPLQYLNTLSYFFGYVLLICTRPKCERLNGSYIYMNASKLLRNMLKDVSDTHWTPQYCTSVHHRRGFCEADREYYRLSGIQCWQSAAMKERYILEVEISRLRRPVVKVRWRMSPVACFLSAGELRISILSRSAIHFFLPSASRKVFAPHLKKQTRNVRGILEKKICSFAMSKSIRIFRTLLYCRSFPMNWPVR